jgi:hypothetical protein
MAHLVRYFVLFMAAIASWACAPEGMDGKWQTIFQTDWRTGIDQGIAVQAPSRTSIEVVDASPAGSAALRVVIHRTDNFQSVANGSPRAEIDFAPLFLITRNAEYEISWSTILARDFKFDTQQPEILAQIHQGPNSGSPPVAILLDGERYVLEVRGSGKAVARRYVLGEASPDLGREVRWLLRYRADHTGVDSEILLFKQGVLVARCMQGCMNAYPDDDQAYLKLGIYKWWWAERATDVTERTVFYGAVSVRKREIH